MTEEEYEEYRGGHKSLRTRHGIEFSERMLATEEADDGTTVSISYDDWPFKKSLITNFVKKIREHPGFLKSTERLARSPRRINLTTNNKLRNGNAQYEYFDTGADILRYDGDDNSYDVNYTNAIQTLDSIFREKSSVNGNKNSFIEHMQRIFQESNSIEIDNPENRSLITNLIHQAIYFPTEILTDDETKEYENSLYRILKEMISAYPELSKAEQFWSEEDLYNAIIAGIDIDDIFQQEMYQNSQYKIPKTEHHIKPQQSISYATFATHDTMLTKDGVVKDFFKLYGTKQTQPLSSDESINSLGNNILNPFNNQQSIFNGPSINENINIRQAISGSQLSKSDRRIFEQICPGKIMRLQ